MATKTDTLACTYAAIMLSDSGLPVTAENIEAACEAAGLSVRKTVPILFARFFEKKSMESLMSAAASVAPTAATPAPAAAAAAPAAGGAAAGGKKKEEKVEEEDDDEMGFGLFD